jgi:hypothetical protein
MFVSRHCLGWCGFVYLDSCPPPSPTDKCMRPACVHPACQGAVLLWGCMHGHACIIRSFAALYKRGYFACVDVRLSILRCFTYFHTESGTRRKRCNGRNVQADRGTERATTFLNSGTPALWPRHTSPTRTCAASAVYRWTRMTTSLSSISHGLDKGCTALAQLLTCCQDRQ